jgi:hypothetical protein
MRLVQVAPTTASSVWVVVLLRRAQFLCPPKEKTMSNILCGPLLVRRYGLSHGNSWLLGASESVTSHEMQAAIVAKRLPT